MFNHPVKEITMAIGHSKNRITFFRKVKCHFVMPLFSASPYFIAIEKTDIVHLCEVSGCCIVKNYLCAM